MSVHNAEPKHSSQSSTGLQQCLSTECGKRLIRIWWSDDGWVMMEWLSADEWWWEVVQKCQSRTHHNTSDTNKSTNSWLTHSFSVVEVTSHYLTRASVSVANSAAVFFGKRADDAVAANFLSHRQNKRETKLVSWYWGSRCCQLIDQSID